MPSSTLAVVPVVGSVTWSRAKPGLAIVMRDVESVRLVGARTTAASASEKCSSEAVVVNEVDILGGAIEEAVCVSTAMFLMSVAARLRATHGRLGEVFDDAQKAVACHEERWR